jgi:hypothetical protein
MSFLCQISRSRSDYLRRTLNDLRQGKKPDSCPLNTAEIGPIGESEHFNGTCLCSLCTCSQHVCPSKYYHEPYPNTIYQSQYSAHFQGRPTSANPRVQYRSKFIPSQAVVSETTSQLYFVPHTNLAPPAQRTPHLGRTMSEAKLTVPMSTTYEQNFPLWKVEKFPIMKQVMIDHRKTEIRLEDKTSYNQGVGKKQERESGNGNPNLRDRKNKIEIEFNYPRVSVQKSDYKDCSKMVKKQRGRPQTGGIQKMVAMKGHYVTTTKADFQRKDIEVDHFTVAKAIQKEKL